MQACRVGIQALLIVFLFYILKYVVLCVFLNVIIIFFGGRMCSQIRLIFWLIKACFALIRNLISSVNKGNSLFLQGHWAVLIPNLALTAGPLLVSLLGTIFDYEGITLQCWYTLETQCDLVDLKGHEIAITCSSQDKQITHYNYSIMGISKILIYPCGFAIQ